MIHIDRHRQGRLERVRSLRECPFIQGLTSYESCLLDDVASWLPDMQSTWELDMMRILDDVVQGMDRVNSRSHQTHRLPRDLDIVAEWFAC
jgi:hypothetical protein